MPFKTRYITPTLFVLGSNLRHMQNNMDNMSTQSVLKSIRVCLVDVVSSHVVTCMSCRLSQFSCRYVYVLSTELVLTSLRVCLVDSVSSHCDWNVCTCYIKRDDYKYCVNWAAEWKNAVYAQLKLYTCKCHCPVKIQRVSWS